MKLTTKQAEAIRFADKIGAKTLCLNYMRNSDKTVRDDFRTNSNIEGTREWGIRMAQSLFNGTFSDEVCDKIINSLK